MPFFSKTYNGLADALITDVIIVETTEVAPDKQLPKYFYTNNATWDTGSEVTIISQKVIDQLDLKPAGKGVMMGIGGDQQGATYIIQVGLPNGDIIKDVEAFSGDILDYDVLIGMDVITKLDVTLTNKENTVFSFRYPSEGGIEIE